MASSGDAPTKQTKPKKKRSELPMLPPCEVCGGKATGFHYGANTCEACKAFYRRTIERALPLRVCDGKCKPSPGGGFSCTYCRFEKCLQTGMSLSAVRRGRYTHQIKVKNIIEAKKHIEKDTKPYPVREPKVSSTVVNDVEPVSSKKMSPVMSPDGSTSLSSASGQDSFDFSPIETSPIVTTNGDGILSEGLSTMSNTLQGPTDLVAEAIAANGLSNTENFVYDPDTFDGFEIDETAAGDLLEMLEEPTSSSEQSIPNVCSERQKELQQITDYILKMYQQYDLSTPEYQKNLPCLEAKYKEERRLRNALFGPMKALTWEEYQKIYTETGLDIDGRRKAFFDCLTDVNNSERINEHYVNFFKDIPGFKDLPFDDQISLIRGGNFQFLIMLDYPNVNVKEKIYSSPIKSKTFGEEEMVKFYGEDELVVMFFRLAEQLQKFQLSPAERALFTVITLLSPDRCETEEGKQRVDYAQASLVAALGCQLNATHPQDPQALARCLVMLADLRYFSDRLCKSQCKLACMFGVVRNDIPPLTKEIMCPVSKMVNSKLSTMLKKM